MTYKLVIDESDGGGFAVGTPVLYPTPQELAAAGLDPRLGAWKNQRELRRRADAARLKVARAVLATNGAPFLPAGASDADRRAAIFEARKIVNRARYFRRCAQ